MRFFAIDLNHDSRRQGPEPSSVCEVSALDSCYQINAAMDGR